MQIGINPGDEYQSYVADGHITIVKKQLGAAKGIIRHIKGDSSITDEESLHSSLN